MAAGSSVIQCGACTLCCRGQIIVLHPERGDDPKAFVTRAGLHPITGEPAYIIPNKPDGSCHYLGAEGCTIWNRHPIMCRTYRCDEDFLKFKKLSRPDRRRRMRAGSLDMKLIERGREMAEKGDAQ